MDRRKFMLGVGGSALGGSALLGSGAFTRIESQRDAKIEVAADPDAYLGLDRCPGSPNSSYIDPDFPEEETHLAIDMSEDNPTDVPANGANPGQGVNSNSFTYFDNLFQICNQGKQTVGIWIEAEDDDELSETPDKYEGDLPRVQFYNSDDSDARVDSPEDAFRLKVGECKCIGMRVMTKGLKEGEQLLENDEIVIHADADLSEDAAPVPDTVTIAGERTDLGPEEQSLFEAIDPSRAFYPLEQDVTVTGEVDIGGLEGNSSVFVGLIAQERFNEWRASEFENEESSLFGFLETAYAGFNTREDRPARAGVGQRLSRPDVLRRYAADGLGDEIGGWTVTFGPEAVTMEINDETATWEYQDHYDFLEDEIDGVETDWSQGAYPFVATFADGEGSDVEVDVTFQSSPQV